MHYVYLIKSCKSEKFYIGYSANLEERIDNHNNGESKATKSDISWKLVYFEAFLSKKDALIREKKLKQYGKSLQLLKSRIANSLIEV